MQNIQIDVKNLSASYKADPKSPSGLATLEGQPVGNQRPDGYWSFQGLAVHRVVYALVTGKDPQGLYIDHRDGNPGNNKASNLRTCSNRQNAQNTPGRSRFLPKGVYINAKTGRVSGCVEGYGLGKSFMLADDHDSSQLNAMCRAAYEAILEEHGEFANVRSFFCQLPIEAVMGPAEGPC